MARTSYELSDLALVLSFYTRLPFAAGWVTPGRSLADAQWAAPFAGAAAALVGWLVWELAEGLGLPPMPAAALVLAAIVMVTGALHEDGLADTADGFGGGHSRLRKLEIMRDSRIGAYGVLALVLSLLLRWSALVALAPSGQMFWVLLAAHAASRAIIPAFMASLPSARSDGLSAGAGTVEIAVMRLALLFGLIALLPLGIWFTFVTALILAAWFVTLRALADRQIGGHTGDVLGTLQQGAEIAILLTAAAALS